MRCQQGHCFSSSLLDATKTRGNFPTINITPASVPPVPFAPAPARVAESPREAPASTDGDEPEFVSERERLIDAMEKCGWVQAKAARLLGLTPRQIGYALKKYKVELKSL
jgi:Nif-specific regulatory protein